MNAKAMNAWVDEALALVPRAPGDQNAFRMVLATMLKNALGRQPENPGWSVADVVAVAAVRAKVTPQFDVALLAVSWPDTQGMRR